MFVRSGYEMLMKLNGDTREQLREGWLLLSEAIRLRERGNERWQVEKSGGSYLCFLCCWQFWECEHKAQCTCSYWCDQIVCLQLTVCRHKSGKVWHQSLCLCLLRPSKENRGFVKFSKSIDALSLACLHLLQTIPSCTAVHKRQFSKICQ